MGDDPLLCPPPSMCRQVSFSPVFNSKLTGQNWGRLCVSCRVQKIKSITCDELVIMSLAGSSLAEHTPRFVVLKGYVQGRLVEIWFRMFYVVMLINKSRLSESCSCENAP